MRFSWKRSAILPCRISRDMLPVIVIGGGPSGSICARRLAARGHGVALFEKRTVRPPSPLETCTPRTRLTIEAACGCAMPSDVATPLEGFWSAWGTADFEQMLWILAGSTRCRFSENRLGRLAASPSGKGRRGRVSGMSSHSWLLEWQNVVGEISVRRRL
jgi:choline dehydrogenase-like flavoprotein